MRVERHETSQATIECALSDNRTRAGRNESLDKWRVSRIRSAAEMDAAQISRMILSLSPGPAITLTCSSEWTNQSAQVNCCWVWDERTASTREPAALPDVTPAGESSMTRQSAGGWPRSFAPAR